MDFTYNEVFIQTLSFWNPDICSHEMAGCVSFCIDGSSFSDTTVAGPPSRCMESHENMHDVKPFNRLQLIISVFLAKTDYIDHVILQKSIQYL